MSTRAVLRFDAATVQVLITQRDDGQSHGSAVVELTAGPRGLSSPLHVEAPTAKEAWARLALLIGQALAACLVLLISSCAPPVDVQCEGPRPFVCKADCVVSCRSFSGDDGGVFAVALVGCTPECRDSTKGGTP